MQNYSNERYIESRKTLLLLFLAIVSLYVGRKGIEL